MLTKGTGLKSVLNKKYPMTKPKAKSVKALVFEYTSRADMACDIRDIPQIIDKVNQLIEIINKSTIQPRRKK